MKKKIRWKKLLFQIVIFLIGGLVGFVSFSHLKHLLFGKNILYLIPVLFVMGLAVFLQIIVHEAGHLLFGILTGYHFSSFRILSFMWMKEEGKIRLKRMSIAGTGGQCLLDPPDMKDGKIPVILYNFGGVLLNLFTSIAAIGLYFVFRSSLLGASFFMIFLISGFAFALTNGIPIHTDLLDNDGYNGISLSKNKEAMHAFWVQMKVNENLSKGIRLKDLPEQWFEFPTVEQMKNSMICAIGVFACNRLMDQRRFEEAEEKMSLMMESDIALNGIYRSLMMCDRMYIEMISDNNQTLIGKMKTKELEQFMKSMKNFPSIIRTQYMCALFCEQDEKKAEIFKEKFEKTGKKYPYKSEVQSERELMEMGYEIYKKKGNEDTYIWG